MTDSLPTNLPVNPTEYRYFLLYTGYAESGATSPVLVSSNQVFPEDSPSWKEAWEVAFATLREAFMAVLREEWMQQHRSLGKCCAAASAASQRFCPECGSSTEGKAFPEDEAENEDERRMLALDLLSSLSCSTHDSYSYDLVQLGEQYGWSIPGNFDEPGVITIISHDADLMLVNYNEEKAGWRWNENKQFWNNIQFRRLA